MLKKLKWILIKVSLFDVILRERERGQNNSIKLFWKLYFLNN